MIALQIQENNRVFGQNVCRREWNIFALLHEFGQLASRTGSKERTCLCMSGFSRQRSNFGNNRWSLNLDAKILA